MFNQEGPASALDRLCIVADDLTGACDTAAAFASRGIHTEVDPSSRIPALKSTVVATCTATRDVAPAAAAAAIHKLSTDPALAAFPHLFKKIDSVFRGNTFVEIAAAVRAFPDRFAVIAPASPRHGRTCTNAILRVEDLTGRSSVPLRPLFEQQGFIPRYIAADLGLAAEIRQAQRQANSAVFCDSNSDYDLAVIIEAAESLHVPILWIGSSGLAHALAATFPQQPMKPTPIMPGHVLLLTGSDHAVSVSQLDHLRQQNELALTVIRVERSVTTDEEIRHATRHASPREVSCLVLNGGDTALQVCRALAIEALELGTEFAPGVPQAIARGGRFDGATVILKSGGFGEADLFSQILRQAQQEIHA